MSMINALPQGEYDLSGTVSEGDIYSSTEKVVGEWIDGKPLYQVTKRFDLGTAANPKITLPTELQKAAMIIVRDGYITMTNPAGYYQTLYTDDNDTRWVTAIPAVSTATQLIYFNIGPDRAAQHPIAYITFRYTKTTD